MEIGNSRRSDLVLALETGLYEQKGAVSSVPAVPEPSGILLVISSLLVAVGRWQRPTGPSISTDGP